MTDEQFEIAQQKFEQEREDERTRIIEEEDEQDAQIIKESLGDAKEHNLALQAGLVMTSSSRGVEYIGDDQAWKRFEELKTQYEL